MEAREKFHIRQKRSGKKIKTPEKGFTFSRVLNYQLVYHNWFDNPGSPVPLLYQSYPGNQTKS
jgi:hypothetical protein